jgi:hypothetical protein
MGIPQVQIFVFKGRSAEGSDYSGESRVVMGNGLAIEDVKMPDSI